MTRNEIIEYAKKKISGGLVFTEDNEFLESVIREISLPQNERALPGRITYVAAAGDDFKTIAILLAEVTVLCQRGCDLLFNDKWYHTTFPATKQTIANQLIRDFEEKVGKNNENK